MDELTRLRDRLDGLERAIAAHYGDASEADQAAGARAKTLRGWGPFAPDPQMEAELAQRAKHPEAYSPPSMELAIYVDHKAAWAAEEPK